MNINQTPNYNTFSFGLDRAASEQILSAPGIFNNGEIEKIIEIGESGLTGTGLNTGTVEAGLNSTIRNCSVNYLYSNNSDNSWIFERLRDVIVDVNSHYYNFDLHSIQTLQFTKYTAPVSYTHLTLPTKA